MSTPRLRYRVPGCRFAFVARLPNYRPCFHKRSKDGSAPALDRAEGLGAGYHQEVFPVLSAKGEKVVVCTYIADASFIDESLQPYSWYKDFVLAGAEEHKLAPEYIESCIRAVHAIRDPNLQRERASRAEIKP
jgi:hypothetical protein